MKRDKLTVPLMERAGHGNQNLNGTCVNGRSREQYDEIVLLATWKPEGELKLDETVSMNDSVYNPIREEVSAMLRMFAKEIVE